MERARTIRKLGLLYESDEWSDWHLKEALEQCGFAVEMVHLADADAPARALSCDVLVNRVFASAYKRGNEACVLRLKELLPQVEAAHIPMVNPPRAFGFETSKVAASEAAAQAGVCVPTIQAAGPAEKLAQLACTDAAHLRFPAIFKPDCGGRGADTVIVHSAGELARAAAGLPSEQHMLVQDYVEPARGFIDRVEIVDGKPVLVFKRSIGEDGLSGYHHGSTYEHYRGAPQKLLDDCRTAARALDFIVGSFDVIESGGDFYFIDFNSVSNVSEDCTELYGMDLMLEHARCIARLFGRER